MAVPIVLSPATAYLTKPNILFPGSDAQATAAEAAADSRIEDVLPAGTTISITAGTIEAE
jgi:hypothetical protein